MLRCAVILLLMVCYPLSGHAQDFTPELNLIYENTTKALGGKEKWEKIQSLYAEGKWSIPHGDEISFIYKTLNPDLSRFDFVDNGSLHTYANFGHEGWVKDPLSHIPTYNMMDEVEQITARNAFMFLNNLVDYGQKGLEIKYEGTVHIDEESLWLIRVVGFKDKEELYFISSEDYRPVIKQSYYFRRGRNGVVNYHITEYMKVDGVHLPGEVLVSSGDLNLKLRYSSYVLNYELERSDFRDPEQQDYTTNILSFSEKDAQDYLNTEIPITRAMGIEVQTLTNNEVELKAPIALNANHFRSAFGGSVDSLFLTAGWTYIRLITDHVRPHPLIVGSKAQTKFNRPITRDFSARLVIPTKREVKDFLREFEKSGRASITLKAEIKEDGQVYATFQGNYVVVKEQRASNNR